MYQVILVEFIQLFFLIFKGTFRRLGTFNI